MSGMSSKYSIELVNSDGLLLADLSGRARARKLTMSRNEAEDISWSLDLNEFEHYCRMSHQDPRNLLINNSTEVRVKRLGTYLAGGQLNYYVPTVSANSQTIDIKASGFLNLLKYRYTDAERIFTAAQGPTIAGTVISESQALTNGDFGITIGAVATTTTNDKIYQRTNVKDLIKDLSNNPTAPFDFEFTYDKVFNTYTQLGSSRPDVVFEFPRNIKEFSVPNDGTGIANQVIALGSGLGEEAQVQATENNFASQLSYQLRQKVITPNDIIDQSQLDDEANSELAAWSFPFELPSITVDGNIAPFITDYAIGDRIRVKLNSYQMVEHIDGLFRIEKIDLNVDDNDNETIKLYLSI